MTTGYKNCAARALLFSSLLVSPNDAFAPSSCIRRTSSPLYGATQTIDVDKRTGKPTGTAFLPEEAIERAAKGNPIEKAKLAKDGTSAFVDVYEYAAKIRAGEMTWEEVEDADLNTVRECIEKSYAY